MMTRTETRNEAIIDTNPWVDDRPAFDVQSFGMTDQGKVRSRNEDHFLIAELSKTLLVRQTSLPQRKTRLGAQRAHLYMVADGLGGHQAGEQASAMTLDAVEEFVLNTFRWFYQLGGPEGRKVREEIQAAFRRTDERLHELATSRPEWRGMATTLTLAYLLDDKLLIAHVGDSRAYLLRNTKLFQLTQDHTVTAELVRRGAIDEEAAKRHEYRNVITNAVGGTEKGVDVETQQVDVKPGDVLMLCTDGLTEMVPIQVICDTLQAISDPRAACERLVALANKNGGKDNTTVIVVHCDRAAEPGKRTELKRDTQLGS